MSPRRRTSVLFLAIVFVALAPSPDLATPAFAQARTGSQNVGDARAEHELLDLANRERSDVPVPPLKVEDCLTTAARRHAVLMVEHQQLSHQFPGEPALSERVASTCSLHLDEAAENVAYAGSVSAANESFMHSPPHRENLLHGSYNVVGIAIIRRGATLFVVQDFGHTLPVYSIDQADQQLTKSINSARESASLPLLARKDSAAIHSEACALARSDSLRSATPPRPGQARYILRFTTLDPQTLPGAATKALAERTLTGFAAGSCFARSATYPRGIYWVVIEFY